MQPMFEAVHSDLDSSFRCVYVACRRFSEDHTWHYHPEYEIAYVVSSAGNRFVGDSIHRYEPGDLVLIGPDLPHCWSDDAGGASPQLRVVQFGEDAFGTGFLNLKEAGPIRRLLRAARSGVHFDASVARIAAPLLEQLPDGGGLKRWLKLVELLNLLAETAPYELLATQGYQESGVANPLNWQRMAVAHRYIRENLSDRISQAHLARLLDMSASSFSRFFKTVTGKSFVAFVNVLRINEVCRRLNDTDESITAVAMRCGYNNISNFNRQFQTVKGMNPTDYRRRLRSKVQHHRHYVATHAAC